MIPCGWGERCGGAIGLRTVIIGDINKATKRRIHLTDTSPSFGDVIISP